MLRGKGFRERNEQLTQQGLRSADPKTLREINKARVMVQMSELKFVKRKCLRCSKIFETHGNSRHMCDHCAYYTGD